MRYEAPKNLEGRELFKHLIANKADIIRQKKSMPIKSAPIVIGAPTDKEDANKGLFIQKGIAQTKMEMPAYGEDFQKRVIANLCGWMDSYNDVSLMGSFNRTVNNNAGMMYFMRDHSSSTKDIIARMTAEDVTIETVALADLGIESEVKMQEALVFRGLFSEKLDSQAYNAYYYDIAKQHSIGLQYVRLDLAVNDPDFGDEYKVWQDTFDQVINKPKAIEKGYYWAVGEQKVFENSWVLQGANSQTPIMPDSLNDNKTTPKVEPVNNDTSQVKDSVDDNFTNLLFELRNGH